MKPLPIFVINLDRSTDRLQKIAPQLMKLGLEWERFAGIDATKSTPEELQEQFGYAPISRRIRATPGDMGCTLSHWHLLDQIARSSAEAALVLEDDTVLAEPIIPLIRGEALALIKRHRLDLLRLEYWPGDPPSRRRQLGTPLEFSAEIGAHIYRLRASAFGSSAYIIRREAAQRLLRHFSKPLVPFDHFLTGQRANMGFKLLRTGFLNPALVLHDVLNQTSLIRAERERLGIEIDKKSANARVAKIKMRLMQRYLAATAQAEWVQMSFAGNMSLANRRESAT